MEPAAIYNAGNYFPNVVLPAVVRGDDAVYLLWVVLGRVRSLHHKGWIPLLHEVFHDVAGDRQGILIVQGVVIGDSGDSGVNVSATQCFGIHFLTGGGLH